MLDAGIATQIASVAIVVAIVAASAAFVGLAQSETAAGIAVYMASDTGYSKSVQDMAPS